MKKYLLLFAINFCFFIAKSQNYPNIDFEFGNFTGWQCFTGSCCPINASTVGSSVYDRHMITNQGDIDYYSGLPKVAPNGSAHGVRIGNTEPNAQSDKIEYTFTVTSQTRILTIYYQAVLQNGGHINIDQAQFAIDVKDNTTNLPVTCTSGLLYEISSTGPYPSNWHNSIIDTSIKYSDWTPITFMLKSYIGHSITISLSTGDCTFGGHFGYSYFDVSFLNDCDNALGSANVINLKAPAGMNFYLWDTLGSNNMSPIDSVQSINVSSSDSTSIFYCITGACLNSCGTNASNFVNSCMDTIFYNMTILHDISKPTAHFTFSANNLNVSFVDGSSGGSAPITDWFWDFGDNNIDITQNPSHLYTKSGTYIIILKVKNGNGCESYFHDTIFVSCFPNQLDAQFKDTLINGTLIVKPIILDTNYISKWYIYSLNSHTLSINNLYLSSNDSVVHLPLSFQNTYYLVLHKYYHKLFPSCSDSIGRVLEIIPANTDTISGYVWKDLNHNGIFDNNEQNNLNITGLQILIFSTNPQFYGNVVASVNDTSGFYSVIIPATNTQIQINGWAYTIVFPVKTIYSLSPQNNHSIKNVNFGLTDTTAKIYGDVYFDIDKDGNYSQNIDIPYINSQIKFDSLVQTLSNTNGYFYFETGINGNYNLSSVPPNSGWISSNNLISVYMGQSANFYTSIVLQSSAIAYPDANVTILPFPLTYVNQPNCALKVQNIGNQNFNGTVTLNYQPGLTVIDPDSGIVNTVNHEITWNINNLTLAKTKTYNIKFDFPTSLPIGSTANFYATLNPSQVDSNLQNNTDSFSTIVLAAFDPNTKTASPPSDAVNHYIKGFDELSYTINFQNTGNAPATNIVIVDTIAPNFDLNSFAFLEASFNPCFLKLNTSNRTIEFILNGIMLPDSMHDEPHSHGSVSFKIKPLHTPFQGETYTNTAQIYFDNNPPIVTNTAIHKIDKNIKVQEVDNKYTIQILPNPMDNLSHLIIAPNPEKSMELTITDILGKEIRVLKSNNGNFAIEKKSLSSGYYNLIVRDANKIIAVEKLIVK